MSRSLTRFPLKRAFVTGAGSGLGKALCCALARQGWTIGVQDVHEAGARDTLKLVEELGGGGRVYVFDIADAGAMAGAAEAFLAANEGIDLLVNNAGVAVTGMLERVSLEDWEWILGINLRGPLYGCHAFLPAMKTQRSGHVVNIASAAGLMAAPTMSPYNVTKYGVVGLSETLRSELVGSGVSISVVCPTFFKTNIANAMRAQDQVGRELAGKLVSGARYGAADIADHILGAVEDDRFYVLPQPDAKILWWLKRTAPDVFIAATRWLYQRQLKRESRLRSSA